MPHLDRERIERLLAGEPIDDDARVIEEHLATCPSCRERLEASRREDRELEALLALLDHPVPSIGPEAAMRRGKMRARIPRRVAAGIAFLAVAGAASATPGSPIRRWLAERIFGEADSGTAFPSSQDFTGEGGVAVVPVGRFEVVFEAAQDDGIIRIALVDAAQLSIQAFGDRPSYALAPGALTVANHGSRADYEIALPRDASPISVRVDETIVFRKDDGTVVTAAARDSQGRYLLEFSGLR